MPLFVFIYIGGTMQIDKKKHIYLSIYLPIQTYAQDETKYICIQTVLRTVTDRGPNNPFHMTAKYQILVLFPIWIFSAT